MDVIVKNGFDCSRPEYNKNVIVKQKTAREPTVIVCGAEPIQFTLSNRRDSLTITITPKSNTTGFRVRYDNIFKGHVKVEPKEAEDGDGFPSGNDKTKRSIIKGYEKPWKVIIKNPRYSSPASETELLSAAPGNVEVGEDDQDE